MSGLRRRRPPGPPAARLPAGAQPGIRYAVTFTVALALDVPTLQKSTGSLPAVVARRGVITTVAGHDDASGAMKPVSPGWMVDSPIVAREHVRRPG